jgi:hypothetical protein
MTHATDYDGESPRVARRNELERMSADTPAAHLQPSETFQYVLCVRSRVDESTVPSFVRDSLREIRAHIEGDHIEVVGAPFLITRPASPGRLDVEVGWPVRNASSTVRIQAGALPINLLRPNERGHT